MRHAAWFFALCTALLLSAVAAEDGGGGSVEADANHTPADDGADTDRVAAAKERWGAGLVTFLQIAPAVTVQIFVFAPVPTLYKVHKERTTGGLPLLPYAMMVCSPFVWSVYAVLVNDMTMILANGSMAVMGVFYVLVFMKYRNPSEGRPAWILVPAGVVMAATVVVGAVVPGDTAATVLGSTAGLTMMVMFAGPLMVIRRVIRDGSTACLPFPTAVAAVVNNALWLAFGVVMDDPFVWVPNIINNLTAITQVTLFCVYGFATAAHFDDNGPGGGAGSAEYLADDYTSPPLVLAPTGGPEESTTTTGAPPTASFAKITSAGDQEMPRFSSTGSLRTAADAQNTSRSQSLLAATSQGTMRTAGSVVLPAFARQKNAPYVL